MSGCKIHRIQVSLRLFSCFVDPGKVREIYESRYQIVFVGQFGDLFKGYMDGVDRGVDHLREFKKWKN
jgi:hypothetical protein